MTNLTSLHISSVLLLAFSLACGGNSPSPGDDAGSDSCVDGETEEESCGEGQRSRICEDGAWSEWGPCSDTGENFVWVSNRREPTCAVRGNGSAECWIDNASKETPDDDFVQISTGQRAACGLRSDGSVRCWGYLVDSEGWRDFDSPTGTFQQLEVSREDQRRIGCGIRTDDTLSCWDDTGSEVVGTLAAPAGTFLDLSVQGNAACGVNTNNEILCWGDDDLSNTPTVSATHIAANGGYGCVLDAAGVASCWDFDGDDIWESSSLTFVDLDIFDDTESEVMVEGGYRAPRVCGLTAGGQVQCWDWEGLLDEPEPGPVAQMSGRCGVLEDGLMRCWYPEFLCTAASPPGLDGANACGFCGTLPYEPGASCACGGTFDCTANEIGCFDGNDTALTATQLPATDDTIDEYQTVTGALDAYTIDWYQVRVEDELTGILQPEFELEVPENQTADLCVYYFEEGEGTTDTCAYSPTFEFMGITAAGCCETVHGAPEKQFINPSFVGDGSGWAFMLVTSRGGANGDCSEYTLRYRF